VQRYKFIQLKFNGFLILALVFFIKNAGISAQADNKITLEQVFLEASFDQKTFDKLKPVNDGEHYTVLDACGSLIRYDYNTGKQVDTVFSATKCSKSVPSGISDYEFSYSSSKLLLATNIDKIYRHSFSADYFIYDLSDQSIVSLFSGGKQQLATFSPAGDNIAFTRNNNLYYKDLPDDKIVQITHDGKKNEIINGSPDWVYEEEFEFTKAFTWSPDGNKIAYYRFDESGVREFNMIIYDSLYPDVYSYKYPKAGQENSKVSIRVYDIGKGITGIMDTGANDDNYIPRIKWTNDPDVLCIVKLNRLQNRVDVLLADARTGESELIFTEENKYYISDITDDYITFIDDNEKFIIKSERDGFMHLYLYDIRGSLINQVTSGEWDVDRFLGFDPGKRLLYYTSSEISPLQRHVYSINPDGTGRKKLTEDPGTNTPEFNNDLKYFVNYNSTANTPCRITVRDSSGALLRILEDNEDLKAKIVSYGFAKKEFIKVPVDGGLELNGYIIKPADFDESGQYPLLMAIYGGPGSQKVTDSWESALAWYQLLAQHGYIVACVDNRGTGARGEEFRKCIYMNLGRLETEDLIESALYLAGLPYVDSSRIGIFGWSYGGYLALSCLTRGAGIFSAGVAVAPVTDWRLYDNIYTERYMRTPQENIKGYEESSILNYADLLKGDLLLIHGTADDNVHLQNSTELIKMLIQNNKQFEMQFYPDRDHSIRGGSTRYHLYKRITDFILRKL
jgi:dipeptidyl-peptidase-4